MHSLVIIGQCIVRKQQEVFKINQFVFSFVVFVLLGEFHFAQKRHHQAQRSIIHLRALHHRLVGRGVQIDIGDALRSKVCSG